jgi:hypothetical protein
MEITLNQLVAMEVCEEQREKFFTVFGQELELPVELQSQKELASLLVSEDFDLTWCKEFLLLPWQNNLLEKTIKEDEFNYWAGVNKACLAYKTSLVCSPSESAALWQEYCKAGDELLQPLQEKKWLIVIQILTKTLEFE